MEHVCARGGAASALVCSVAAIAIVVAVSEGASFMSIFPGTGAASARPGHAQAIARRSEPVQFNFGWGFWVEIAKRHARYRGPTALRYFGMMQLCC